MPGAKTHDAITLLLALPVAAGSYAAYGSLTATTAIFVSFLFGGLMFGPDLDTLSKHYSRWWIFRPIWLPYRWFFKHRSRWSHGLLFGTFIRVVYFLGILSICSFAVWFFWTVFQNDAVNDLATFARTWRSFASFAGGFLRVEILIAIFAGMWAGAASHTFTDMAGTYIKTGRVTEFL